MDRQAPRRSTGGLYYGWIVVGTLAVTETVSWGVLFYAFAVFQVPMGAELGWSSAALTGAYSAALLVSALAAPLVGRWLDRHGPRALMTAGAVAGALLVLLWAGVEDLRAFYLVWGGLGLAMAATLYEPAFATVATWFVRHRNRALLLLTVAAGFASTIFLPLAGALIEAVGWRRALVLLAALLAVATIPPHALLLRRRPEDLGLRPDGAPAAAGAGADPAPPAPIPGVALGAALRDPGFWWLNAGFSLATLVSVAIGVHLVPLLAERGDDLRFAAAATGLIGAAQVLSRVAVTLVGSRLPQTTIAAGIFALQGAALLVLLLWRAPAGAVAAALLLGGGRGATTLLRANLVADRYGGAHYGAIGGTLASFVTGARALAPVGAGAAVGLLGGYDPVLWLLAGLAGLSALAMLPVGAIPPPAAHHAERRRRGGTAEAVSSPP